MKLASRQDARQPRVSANIAGVNASATETGTTADEVLSSVQDLTSQAERLQKAAGDFIQTLRVA